MYRIRIFKGEHIRGSYNAHSLKEGFEMKKKIEATNPFLDGYEVNVFEWKNNKCSIVTTQ